MRTEIDILLENPLQTIDIELINNGLSEPYAIIHYVPHHFLALTNKATGSSIRIHEDGRVYVKIDLGSVQGKNQTLGWLILELNNFLGSACLNQSSFKDELNFSFYGAAAHSYYWKMQDELKRIGEDKFGYYDLRTFSSDEDSIHIKIEPVTAFNLERACSMGLTI